MSGRKRATLQTGRAININGTGRPLSPKRVSWSAVVGVPVDNQADRGRGSTWSQEIRCYGLGIGIGN